MDIEGLWWKILMSVFVISLIIAMFFEVYWLYKTPEVIQTIITNSDKQTIITNSDKRCYENGVEVECDFNPFEFCNKYFYKTNYTNMNICYKLATEQDLNIITEVD